MTFCCLSVSKLLYSWLILTCKAHCNTKKVLHIVLGQKLNPRRGSPTGAAVPGYRATVGRCDDGDEAEGTLMELKPSSSLSY